MITFIFNVFTFCFSVFFLICIYLELMLLIWFFVFSLIIPYELCVPFILLSLCVQTKKKKKIKMNVILSLSLYLFN